MASPAKTTPRGKEVAPRGRFCAVDRTPVLKGLVRVARLAVTQCREATLL